GHLMILLVLVNLMQFGCAPPFFYFCTMPCLTPKWKAFHYPSSCCSCLLPRVLCWI
ncbi:hypothetical protein S245_006106, partial [Arachis hypogaea]